MIRITVLLSNKNNTIQLLLHIDQSDSYIITYKDSISSRKLRYDSPITMYEFSVSKGGNGSSLLSHIRNMNHLLFSLDFDSLFTQNYNLLDKNIILPILDQKKLLFSEFLIL